MLDRFYISLVHPSRIGLFVKDKIWMPLIHILIMLAIFTSMLAVRSFTIDYFSGTTSKTLVDIVENSKNNLDIKFENNKLTGTQVRFETEEYFVYFLNKPTGNFSTICQIVFEEDSVTFRYYLESKTVKYEDLKYDLAFDFKNIKKHDQVDRMRFMVFVDKVFTNFNFNYQRAIFIMNFIFSLIIIGAAFGLCVLFSYFTNPPIDKDIRVKLCMYDTLVFFFPLFFSIALATNWIMYLGLILPVIYARITFSHIMKVRIKKR